MRKLIVFLAAVLLTAMSAKTFAQSTGINPMVDSIHTYTVNNVDPANYMWVLTTSPTDTASASDLFGVVADITSGEGTNSIQVLWDDPVIGEVYFLHIVVTDGGNSCINRKVLAIQPVNNFQLDIVNAMADGTLFSTDDSLDYTVCPPEIPNTIVWNDVAPIDTVNNNAEAIDFTYEYGVDSFFYKITAEGINFATTGWTANFDISNAGGFTSGVTVDYYIGADLTAPVWVTGLAIGTGQEVTVPAGGDQTIWIKITVDNGTTNENITANDYTIALTNLSKDSNNNNPTDLGNGSTVQTLDARPDIGDIQFD